MSHRMIPLAKICLKITDGTHHSPPIVGEGVPYVTAKHIKETGITFFDDPWYVSEASHKQIYSRCDPQPGDVLYIKDGVTTGVAAVNAYDFPFSMLSSVALLRPNPQICASKFLASWLNSPTAKRKYLNHMGGAAIKRLTLAKIKRFEIPLPPLAEQKRIGRILDAADALRAKRRESLAQLDALIQSTFLEMFGDPVTNPKGFAVRSLAEFYVDKRNGTKCGPFGSALKKNELVNAGIPVWSMDNIDSTGRMALPFRMWIKEDKYRQLEPYSVLDGDVIISRAGTVGKMCVASSGSRRSILSTNLIRLRLGPSLLPIYFVSLMTYCKARIGRLKTGPDGAFTHMSTGVLDNLKFPYPPLSLQRHFAKTVESAERQKERLGSQLNELDTLFASLQSRAFNGEL